MSTQGKAVTDKETIMTGNCFHCDRFLLRIMKHKNHLFIVRVNISGMEIWSVVFGFWVGDVPSLCNFVVFPSAPEQGWDSVLKGPTISSQFTIILVLLFL